jgi:hypothetical protein
MTAGYCLINLLLSNFSAFHKVSLLKDAAGGGIGPVDSVTVEIGTKRGFRHGTYRQQAC